MSKPAIIEASSVRVQTMADGTLRIVCDIEPANARAAFELMGAPGTPLAIAALRTGHAKASDQPQPQGEVGYWCLRAVQRCKEPEFWQWITFSSLQDYRPTNEQQAAAVVREVCGIESRRELDDDLQAREKFSKKLDQPYTRWLMQQRQQSKVTP